MRGTAQRGDGVGIEYTATTLRGVRLDRHDPDRVHAIAETPIVSPGDERSIEDAFVRLRAELGNPTAPARLATFPPGTWLQRIDTTGRSGPELNATRTELEDEHDVTSTMLVDDGPRRWMLMLSWDALPIRAIELLAERAGFVDVAIDPSPVALGRVAPPTTTWVRRDAAAGEAFRMALHHGVPVAAITDDTVGRVHPNVELRSAPISLGRFDERLDAGDLAALFQELSEPIATQPGPPDDLVLGERSYPPYPPHDIRSAQRQCVALGAAVGAAGLAGRLRPVDITLPMPNTDEIERPWAIEPLTELEPAPPGRGIGPLKRAAARVLPRRSPGR